MDAERKALDFLGERSLKGGYGTNHGTNASSENMRSGMRASPVLQLEAGDALEFALVVGDQSESCGFSVGCNPEIVATDHLTPFFQRDANLAIG